jgi:lauroyl/myristoyl acyltransferase
VEVAAVAQGAEARAAAFARAVQRVRNGGLVVMAADVDEAELTAPVPCLARAVRMARGPFALARITGAPLIPIVACWNDERITVVAGDALRGDGCNRELEASYAAAAVGWLADVLRGSPEQIRLYSLRWLLDAPDQRANRSRNSP